MELTCSFSIFLILPRSTNLGALSLLHEQMLVQHFCFMNVKGVRLEDITFYDLNLKEHEDKLVEIQCIHSQNLKFHSE